MPVGAYGGRRDIMELIAPLGPVYQAGTLSGNPVAMAAGLEQLRILWEHPEYYTQLEEKGQKLYGGMRKLVKKYGAPCVVNDIGSLGCIFFTQDPVRNYQEAKSADTQAFARYFAFMLEHGIHLAPSQFEAMFLSEAHKEEQIEETLQVFEEYLKQR